MDALDISLRLLCAVKPGCLQGKTIFVKFLSDVICNAIILLMHHKDYVITKHRARCATPNFLSGARHYEKPAR